MVKYLVYFLLVSTVVGQSYTFHDQAWLGRVASSGVVPNTLTNGAIAYWKLDNEASWIDSSGNSRTLTEDPEVWNSAGLIGNAATYTNNINNFLYRADEDALSCIGNSLTIACWVNFTATNTGQALVYKDSASNGTREWGIGLETSGGPYAFINVFTNAVTAGLTAARLTNAFSGAAEWNFVVAQIDNTNKIAKIRVATTGAMGAWAQSSTFNGFGPAGIGTNTTAQLRLGIITTVYPLNGLLDEVGLWNRLLTDSEITNLWNNGVGRTWSFD